MPIAGCWKIGGYSVNSRSKMQAQYTNDGSVESKKRDDSTDQPSTSAQNTSTNASGRRPTFAGLKYYYRRRKRSNKRRKHKQLSRGMKHFSVRLEDDDDEDEDDFYAETNNRPAGRERHHNSQSSTSTTNTCTLRKARIKRILLCGRGIMSDPEDGKIFRLFTGQFRFTVKFYAACICMLSGINDKETHSFFYSLGATPTRN